MGASLLQSSQRYFENSSIIIPTHSSSNNILSLPPTRKFVRTNTTSATSMRRLLFFATIFSACFLLRHINIHSHVFPIQPLVPVDSQTIIPGRAPPYPHNLQQHHLNIVEYSQLQLRNAGERPAPIRASVSKLSHDPVVSEISPVTTTTPKQPPKSNTQNHHPHVWTDPSDVSTFNRTTSLNYFHMHKTGGVSFKERLFDYFINDSQIPAHRANVFDTCHISTTARNELGIEKEWSCDWHELTNLSKHSRNKIDVIVGHQYWEHGAGYWIPNRDLRYFTLVRHPLHRKISFFYHFFIRNTGRKEDSVTVDELIDFVLGRNMPDSPLMRDAGPGYYASRLWSDGLTGYDNFHRFAISDDTAASMVENSIRRLRNHFVFIGLQTQEPASLCMLKKTLEAFVKAHEFGYDGGLEEIVKQRERMNTGSYSLSAKALWLKMNDQQRNEFRRVENVDLAIYRECVKMFHEMVKRFGCEDLVVERDDDDIAL